MSDMNSTNSSVGSGMGGAGYMYMSGMPPTPGISPPTNNNSVSPSNAESNGNGQKGRPKKRKLNNQNSGDSTGPASSTPKKPTANRTQKAKSAAAAVAQNVTNSSGMASNANALLTTLQPKPKLTGADENGRAVNSGMIGGSNGEDSPEDFNKNFDNHLGRL